MISRFFLSYLGDFVSMYLTLLLYLFSSLCLLILVHWSLTYLNSLVWYLYGCSCTSLCNISLEGELDKLNSWLYILMIALFSFCSSNSNAIVCYYSFSLSTKLFSSPLDICSFFVNSKIFGNLNLYRSSDGGMLSHMIVSLKLSILLGDCSVLSVNVDLCGSTIVV